VNLDPTIGAEIKKTRPAVVISSDAVGKLPIKLIVPIRTAQVRLSSFPHHNTPQDSSVNEHHLQSYIN
jgi:mRNA interferase MazF